MRIGVGLPSTIPGAPASLTLDWARRADAGPFSTLATLDRLVYDSLDSLTALAAIAAITTRVRIATNILVSPLYAPAALAKAAASLDALSGGRFTLGIAVGARKEDYDAAGVSYASRGRRLVEQLDSPARPLGGSAPRPAHGASGGAATAARWDERSGLCPRRPLRRRLCAWRRAATRLRPRRRESLRRLGGPGTSRRAAALGAGVLRAGRGACRGG